jgi:hypothetical protein
LNLIASKTDKSNLPDLKDTIVNESPKPASFNGNKGNSFRDSTLSEKRVPKLDNVPNYGNVSIGNDKEKDLSLKINNSSYHLEVSNSSNKEVWVILQPEYRKPEGMPSVIRPRYVYSTGEYIKKIPPKGSITVLPSDVEGIDTTRAFGTASAPPENLKIRVLNPDEVRRVK